MSTFKQVLKQSQQSIIRNSPQILTVIGVVGVGTTAYLTAKATFKASEILTDEVVARDVRAHPKSASPLTPREKVELVGTLYIPAIASGLLACACIVSANRVGTRKTAAMAAAYTLSERALDEYRAKVVEKIGDKQERAIRDDIASERTRKHIESSNEVVILGSGETLCYDSWSGRTFKSDMETLRSAENSINKQIHEQEYATVSDYYSLIGLDEISGSGDFGWSHSKYLELHFTSVLIKDKEPALSVDFGGMPLPNPWQYS